MKVSEILSTKLLTPDLLPQRLNEWRGAGKRIVFTNGCFDILHAGHITYLAKAAELGDILFIGLNSDDSVRRLKGNGRPVNGQDARALVLASLLFVDAVLLFEEDTPQELISRLLPDVLVKGGDYRAEDVVGYDTVTENGGRVVIIDFVGGFSTTGILNSLNHG